MQLVSLKKLNLSFGTQEILKDVDFDISKGQRICLIGRNGTGKSSLLKIIEGKNHPDSGEVIIHNNAVIASMIQDIPNDIKGDVKSVILSGLGEVGEKLVEYQDILASLESSPENLHKLEDVQKYIDENHAWEYMNEADVIITKLQLNTDKKFSDLSGGMKRRVILARALIRKPDLLLLDEPTNHLDISSITWLEEFLKQFAGAILFITHDRKFLNNVAKSIIELDRGNLYSFEGNYLQFLEKKEAILQAEQKSNKEFDKKLAQEESWIRQGIKARRTRNEGRVRALEKMRSERKQRKEQIGKIDINVSAGEKSSRKVIVANNVGHKYQEKYLFKNFSTEIVKGDKVAILGSNGCGKSTLLNILLGKLKPSDGSIEQAFNLQIAYFDQLRDQLDEKLNIMDNVKEGSDFIQINDKSIHVITYLQKFLFSPDRLHAPITHLSGGEKNRLLLAKILSKPSNIIVLDEPTNDLDIETLEILEEMLINYQGTILLISHDREFINNIATSTIVFEEHGLEEYIGGYDDWLRQRVKTEALKNPKKEEPKVQQKQEKIEKQNQLNHEQRKTLKSLPVQIEKLEKGIGDIEGQMTDADFYKKSKKEIQLVQSKLNKLNKDLEEKFLLWEELLALE
ncbi:ATP-binding cassette domain-containing protein [Pseudofrancisella aestuarii]|uniref:ATP-binding protein Uup n=1 Tax=Pseudofrancisella aestuarii TaxID=2670347 RepID=A0ABV9TB30_9GAMM|nr:ATP-binding cassette domain-containing protein [Pseudofrancisella aestuarii]